MPVVHRYSIYAGLLSGLLFFLTSSGALVGVFVLFTPLVPLFWAGFRLGGHAIGHASAVALGLCLLLMGPHVSSLLLLFFITPAWVFGRQLLKARLTRQGGLEWYATGNAIVALVTYVVIAFILLGYYLSGSDTDLLTMIQNSVDQNAAAMEPAISEQFKQFSTHYPYLVFGTILWFSTLTTYGAACLANFICKTYGRALRPSIAIRPYDPPLYVPVWLLLSGLAGFFVPHETAYILQTVFFLFLIPYFMLGIALMHEKAKGWEGRALWLSLTYLLLFMAQWPAFLLAGWGFVHHIGRLSEQKGKGGAGK